MNLKIIISFIVLLYSAGLSAQNDTNLILENKQVYFEKVYHLDTASSASIERLLTMNIPKLNGIQDYNKSGEVITATLKNVKIDYKKHVGNNIAAAAIWPFFANVSIVWKDGRYRVTVTNTGFNTPPAVGTTYGNEFFTKKKGAEWSTMKTIVNARIALQKHLEEMFYIKDTGKMDF